MIARARRISDEIHEDLHQFISKLIALVADA